MRVLLVTQDFPPDRGGIQTYSFELARGLEALGHHVGVLCPDVGATHEADRTLDVERVRVPGSWLFVPLLASMKRRIERERITHVVYAQWPLALWHLLQRGKRPPVPTVCLVHGRELLFSVLDPLTSHLLPRVFATFDASLPVSRPIERLLQETSRPAGMVRIVPPGVDAELFRPAAAERLREKHGLSGKKVLLSIGRLAARKNLPLLIDVMPELLRTEPEVRLVLGGDGPEKSKLEERVRSLGLEGKVVFLGAIADADLAAHYSAGDVFVLASLASSRDVEGFGIVLLEAAACGLPVVAARSGGMPDALDEGKTGLLYEPSDRNQLVSHLRALLSDDARRAAMGRNGRARIEREFTWKHNALRVAEVLQGCQDEGEGVDARAHDGSRA